MVMLYAETCRKNKDCKILYNVSSFSWFTKEQFHGRSEDNRHRACKVTTGKKGIYQLKCDLMLL